MRPAAVTIVLLLAGAESTPAQTIEHTRFPERPTPPGAWVLAYDGRPVGKASFFADSTTLQRDSTSARIVAVAIVPVCGDLRSPDCAPVRFQEKPPLRHVFDCAAKTAWRGAHMPGDPKWDVWDPVTDAMPLYGLLEWVCAAR